MTRFNDDQRTGWLTRHAHLTMLTVCIASPVVAACGAAGDKTAAAVSWDIVRDVRHRTAVVTGLAGPEAVRYDPDQDVYFVANFNGESAGDSNGFITRVDPEGSIETLRFMVGTEANPLHAPRGMFITGDTLWAADADGVHAFDRRTGVALTFIDFTGFEPGFLNDIAQGPDGALYITDTGRSLVFRLADGQVTIALEDSTLRQPNGITWDEQGQRFLIASWAEGPSVQAWRPDAESVEAVGTLAAGRFDGIELVDGNIVVASQTDSALHVVRAGSQHPFIQMPGRPADIGIDTRRHRVAVPYIALDRVDIWQLPQR